MFGFIFPLVVHSKRFVLVSRWAMDDQVYYSHALKSLTKQAALESSQVLGKFLDFIMSTSIRPYCSICIDFSFRETVRS